MADNTRPDEYQGWTNRETWLAALWVNNEQWAHEEALTIARTHPDSSDLWLGETIWSEVVEPLIGNDKGGFLADLVNAFADRVDWREIGASFRESAQ